MSTKIYNAYKYNGDLKDLKSHMIDVRKSCIETIKKYATNISYYEVFNKALHIHGDVYAWVFFTKPEHMLYSMKMYQDTILFMNALLIFTTKINLIHGMHSPTCQELN